MSPVSIAARLGAQLGDATNAWVKVSPSSANRWTFGVRTSFDPYGVVSSKPRSSQRNTTMFGFAAAGLMGTAGLTIDVGQVFVAKKAFTAATQASALAGANALLASNANLTTVTAALSGLAGPAFTRVGSRNKHRQAD